MMDPYYRTIRGFQTLIEKDWVSFGYKFQDRVGHAHLAKSAELSPVFQQWIDCVWQLWVQFPTEFEFNEQLLIAILDSLYSCRYGNFLFNCQLDRELHHVKQRCFSLWRDVNRHLPAYRNPLYRHATFLRSFALPPVPGVMSAPPCSSRSNRSPRTHTHTHAPPQPVADSVADAAPMSQCCAVVPPVDLTPDLKKLRLWTGYYLRWEKLCTREPPMAFDRDGCPSPFHPALALAAVSATVPPHLLPHPAHSLQPSAVCPELPVSVGGSVVVASSSSSITGSGSSSGSNSIHALPHSTAASAHADLCVAAVTGKSQQLTAPPPVQRHGGLGALLLASPPPPPVYLDHYHAQLLQALQQVHSQWVREMCRPLVLAAVHRAVDRVAWRQWLDAQNQLRTVRRHVALAEARLAVEKVLRGAMEAISYQLGQDEGREVREGTTSAEKTRSGQ